MRVEGEGIGGFYHKGSILITPGQGMQEIHILCSHLPFHNTGTLASLTLSNPTYERNTVVQEISESLQQGCPRWKLRVLGTY